jgi:hypothetical protein
MNYKIANESEGKSHVNSHLYTYIEKPVYNVYSIYICIFSVPDIRRFQRVDVVFCRLNMSDVWVQRIEGDIWGQGWGPKDLVGKGRLILSMGLAWREVRILAHRDTMPNKGFFVLIKKHVSIIHCKCCKYVFVLFYIFILCRLKIYLVKQIRNMCLFLGPLAWLGTYSV